MCKKWVRWLLLVLAASPALLPLYIILHWGVDFPYWDQWEVNFAGMYVKAHQGKLHFADIAAQHNEHRMLFPRLVFLIVNSLTHWNVIFELLVQWVIVLATSVMVLWLYHVNVRDEQSELPADQGMPAFLRLESIFLWLLANLLIFSPTQVENWLWGIGIANVLPMLFIMAAIIAARCLLGLWTRTTLVILLCSAATFTSGSGVVSWALAGLVLLWSQSWDQLKSKKWVALSLVGAIIGNTVLYFQGYVTPDRGNQQFIATGIHAIASYFLVFIGALYSSASFAPFEFNSIAAGIVLLLLYAACFTCFIIAWLRRDRDLCLRMIAWHAVAGYGLLCGVLTTMARSGMGQISAVSSRYSAFSLYLPVGLIYLTPIIVRDLARTSRAGERARLIGPVLATLLILGWIEPVPKMLELSQAISSNRRAGKSALLFVKILPENPMIAQAVFPFPYRVKEFAPVLNEMGYLHPPLIESPDVALLKDPDARDFAAGLIEQSYKTEDGNFAQTGWAFFPSLHRPADVILLCYNDEQDRPIIFGMFPVGMPRNDRVSETGDAMYRFCGWSAEFPLGAFPALPRQIVVTVWAFNSDTGHAYQLKGSTTLNR